MNELQHLHRWTVGRVQRWHKSLYFQTAPLAMKVCQRTYIDKKLDPGHKNEAIATNALEYKFNKKTKYKNSIPTS